MRWMTLLLATLLAAGQAAAATTPSNKLAVLEVRARGTVDAKSVEGLSPLIASEASRFPLRVVSGGDLTALLGFDRERQLLGCSEGACMAEVGGALGVEFLLLTEVSEVAGTWLFSATVMDVARATALQRETGQTDDKAQLVALSTTTVRAVLSRLTSTRAAAAVPAAAVASEPAGAGGSPVPGLLVGGAGLACVGAGVYFGLLARGDADEAPGAPTLSEFESLRDSAGRKALTADLLYGVGAVGLGLGAVLLLTSGSGEPPAVALGLSSRGAALQFSGEF